MNLTATLEQMILAARRKYGEPVSTQESLGVITEEYHELIAAIHVNDRQAVIDEALDVAASALSLAMTAERGAVEFMERSGLR